MPRIQVIGDPIKYVNDLMFVLRIHGERELVLRLKRLNRHSLLHLLPKGVNKTDDELRTIVLEVTKRRLVNLNAFQQEVDEWLHEQEPEHVLEEQRAEEHLVLGLDESESKFKGGRKLSGNMLRRQARLAFANNKRVIKEEMKEWNSAIDERIRKESK